MSMARDRARWRWTVAALAGLALLLLYGVIPFIIGRGGGTYAGILSFTSVDFQAFHASASPQYGLWPNLLGFYGYWAERLGRSTVFSTSPSWWPLTTAILVGLAIAGA